MANPDLNQEEKEWVDTYETGALESDLDDERRAFVVAAAEKASTSGRDKTTTCKGPIVIGIGNPWRGDDGIGHAVVHALQETPSLTTATTSGEPAELMDLWQGHDPVILVDAIVTGAVPGTIHRLDAVEPLPRTARYSSHGIGLAEAVELARALDALPPSLVIYGIEPASLEDGAGLSPELADRITEAAGQIRAELESSPVPRQSR
ncbi:MAG: hydrogenase maturation protease [Thioalkalivibrio sp.]|nr:hydrogenase maturation protease [Thioalkalivibrio sp.]